MMKKSYNMAHEKVMVRDLVKKSEVRLQSKMYPITQRVRV